MKRFYHKQPYGQIRRVNPKVSILIILSCFILLVGCFHNVSYYDARTYQNLTGLKAEMKLAFEEFVVNGASGIDDSKILKAFRLKIARALEYEMGKELNDDTVAQFVVLDKTIRKIVDRSKKNGDTLSAGYCKGKRMILEQAFDMAIATERGKIKEN